jgi:hypothetical protein
LLGNNDTDCGCDHPSNIVPAHFRCQQDRVQPQGQMEWSEYLKGRNLANFAEIDKLIRSHIDKYSLELAGLHLPTIIQDVQQRRSMISKSIEVVVNNALSQLPASVTIQKLFTGVHDKCLNPLNRQAFNRMLQRVSELLKRSALQKQSELPQYTAILEAFIEVNDSVLRAGFGGSAAFCGTIDDQKKNVFDYFKSVQWPENEQKTFSQYLDNFYKELKPT